MKLLAILAAILGTGAALTALQPEIDAVDLAERIMNADQNFQLYDLRPRADFDNFHLPTAKPFSTTLPQDVDIVLYSEGNTRAWTPLLLRLRGYKRVTILHNGVHGWITRLNQNERLNRFFGGTPSTEGRGPIRRRGC